MFAQTSAGPIAYYRRRGPAAMRLSAFSGFGDATADAKKLQTMLNQYPSSLAPLVVDGVIGSKTAARIREFQTQLALPATGVADSFTLQMLGISSGSGGTWGDVQSGAGNDVTGGVDGQQSGSVLQSIFDVFTLKGIRDAVSPATQAAIDSAKITGNWTAETAKAAANAGGAAAAAALKWLADNGDLIAKIALALGVGYGTALAISIGGAGFVVILLLKKK